MAEDKILDRTGATKFGAWVGILGSVVTIILTVWNADMKVRIDDTEARVKLSELTIHQRAEFLEEDKQQIDRYKWAVSFLPTLTANSEQDTYLKLLQIRLALKPNEAKALFSGLSQSSDPKLHLAGQTGLENLENEATFNVVGSIEEPTPNQDVVDPTIRCSGLVDGLQPGLGLWIVVEKPTGAWPKEGRPVRGSGKQWTANISEDGGEGKFSIALFVADQAASRQIQEWLDAGVQACDFPQMKDVRGATRIARVDGLSLKHPIAKPAPNPCRPAK